MGLRALIALLVSLCCLSAQAQQSKTTISGQIAASSAAGLAGGTILNNMVNSYVDWLTCTGTGGLVYWNVGVPTCLSIGTNGQVLNIVAGKPTWTNAGSITSAALTSANDTNVTLTLGGSPTTSLLNATSITAGWIGVLAAARLNSNVVQGITNDTNITGSITAQNLILGWTGTLAVSRGGTGIASFGTGVATALGVNIGTAGAFVINGGALGIPSSGTLTNATGLPVGGISGLGTGVATALGVNTGSAGAVVLFNGALGTPSSGTLTNATGLPTTGLTGTLQAAQEPAHTGDATNTAGSLAMTVVKINGATPAAIATSGSATDLTTGTVNGARLPYNTATQVTSPSDPTGTASTTPVMMGMGVTSCRVTPSFSTRVFINIQGVVNNNTASDGYTIGLRQGTGAGPANAAAEIGTLWGTRLSAGGGASNANVNFPFTLTAIASGLTPGVAIWWDASLAAITGGTAAMKNVTCTAFEF